MNDPIMEVTKHADEQSHSEAPLSIHIDAYFKGFHCGITVRKEENSIIPSTKVVSIIESLIEKGFKPSWNEDTNKASLGSPVAPKTAENPQEVCQHPQDRVTVKQSSGNKNPQNKGKYYKQCLVCNKFLGWS
jgi:hypothetical protein